MKLIIGILLGFIGLLVSRLVFYKKDLRRMVEDLRYIDEKNLNISKLTSSSKDRDMRDLIDKINQILKKSQELEISHRKKEREIKEMIASISHDLRTPLTSIKGYVDMLEADCKSDRDRRYIEIIQSRARSLEDLIASFYELSKLELRDYDYQLDYIDLEGVLGEVLVSFYDKFKENEIEPRINLSPDLDQVLGDRKALERVFINLIDNGIKYSKSFLQIDLLKEEGGLVIDFINDTEGLEDEDIEKIFDRFFVMDTSRQSESTGLGLYITRRLVEDLGYRIEASLEGDNIKVSLDFRAEKNHLRIF